MYSGVDKSMQRSPPLLSISRPLSRVRSSSTTSAPARAAKIAAVVPAVAAPMTITLGMRCQLAAD